MWFGVPIVDRRCQHHTKSFLEFMRVKFLPLVILQFMLTTAKKYSHYTLITAMNMILSIYEPRKYLNKYEGEDKYSFI